MVTAKQVRLIAAPLNGSPRSELVDAIASGWSDAARAAKLTTRQRAAAFLGQIMAETGGLAILSESGAYRYETIVKIFGVGHHSAKVTDDEARRIAALPVAQRGPVLFNRVYGVGNPSKAREFNNTGPNDGWLYRGGGMMQCTGKSNYARMAKRTGLPLVEHPEMLHQPITAFKAAYLEWGQDGRANKTADAINLKNPETLADNRRVINGGTNGLANFRKCYVKALEVLVDYGASPAATLMQEPGPEPQLEDEPAIDPVLPDPTVAPPNVQPLDEPDAVGDPALYNVQRRLKGRRYSPGVLDGRWGSGTSGALSAFRNDRGVDFSMPRNLEQFHDIADDIRAELAAAEAEGWYRPVSEERAQADPKLVKELAPETVPAKRNFLVAMWGSIVTFFATIWDTISGYVSSAYDFFTDHEDTINDHPGIWSTVTDHLSSVPTPVWLLIAGLGMAFVAYNAWSGIETSKRAVKTGERQ